MGSKKERPSSIKKENTRRHHERTSNYFSTFNQKTAEQLIQLRKDENKRFATRITLSWKRPEETKGLSENSASSNVIGAQSFFSYYDLPIKTELPTTKIEPYQPTLEDLQIKILLNLMRDCPCRVNDLATKLIPQISDQKEFMIKSERESIIGKVYLSEEFLELYQQLKKANQNLPTTREGLAEILARASQIAEIPHLHPHLLRKFFFTIGVNLNSARARLYASLQLTIYQTYDRSIYKSYYRSTKNYSNWADNFGYSRPTILR
jgi:integrase